MIIVLAALAVGLTTQHINCHQVSVGGEHYINEWVAEDPPNTTMLSPSQSECEAAANAKPAPAAEPTDGTEPVWTEVPLTQKIPHCPPDEKLMMFDGAYCPNCAIYATGNVLTSGTYASNYVAGEAGHPARWLPPGAHPSDTPKLGGATYRCFKKTATESTITGGLNITITDGTDALPQSLDLVYRLKNPIPPDGGFAFPFE